MNRVRSNTTGLLLSGGLDSAILLGHLLGKGERVQPIYVRSGLHWEREELRSVRRFLAAMASPRLEDLVVLEQPLADLYAGHWSLTGRNVPDASTNDSAVYLPGRNALLLMKPALWCQMHGIEQLALGVLKSNPFGDTAPEFFDDFASALHRATGARIRFLRPFAQFDKRQVMELGRGLPLEHTLSCIAPIGGLHCGQCNKCAERMAAFAGAAMEDPTEYATFQQAVTKEEG